MWHTVPVVLYDKFPILRTVFESLLGDTLKSGLLVFKMSAHTRERSYKLVQLQFEHFFHQLT